MKRLTILTTNKLTLRLKPELRRAINARVKLANTTPSQLTRDALSAHLGLLEQSDSIAHRVSALVAEHADGGQATLEAMRAENAELNQTIRDLLGRFDLAAEVAEEDPVEKAMDPRTARLLENLTPIASKK